MIFLYKMCLKIRHSPIVAPIPLAPPPQRLVLGPAHLPRPRVLLALELGRRALAHPRAEGAGRDGGFGLLFHLGCRGGHVARGGYGGGRGHGGGGGGGVVRGQGRFGGALQALELGLLRGGQARRGRGVLEEGGAGGAEAGWARGGEEAPPAGEGSEEAGHGSFWGGGFGFEWVSRVEGLEIGLWIEGPRHL